MTTYPLATLACTIDENGISAPSYDDIYLSLCASFRGIYGSDVVLDADTQDGQWLAILAQGFNDTNNACIAAYNARSPSSAQGAGLASVVKINGLQKQAATYSTCDVTITGAAGTIITNGTVKDADGAYTWALPASVTIPSTNSITVTATCTTAGAISAAIGSLTKIGTPTLGWISVTNAVAASPGTAQESDAKLRQRQSRSTALGATSPMETLAAAIEDITGVTRVTYDENTTDATNGNGTPSHSVALVIEGGDADAISQTIARSKIPGGGTAGTISKIVIDSRGMPATIKFSTPTYRRIIVNVSIKALTGYTVTIGNALVSAIASYINDLPLGESVYLTQVISAGIQGSGGIGTFNLLSLEIAIYGDSPAAADIPIAFDESATCVTGDVSLSLIS
ncbi:MULTISPECIES: baseplate J/gp47 family protein [unclassified Novosphingobium]|uniref:baseplate J/gp47 family protein n=1 Tax=unclassified Novosphingobium TaxID=2644732 RepID=UPI000D300FC1|nr:MULTISPECIES: baseplate J/gp47 family protein [unclassified Novosphingobium]PTR06458.1 putative phage protein gp47/JayE [Novosphingobium sp. GV055]PUA94877.1 putative phage protein gp47/JayE [Novosphingobium sp. GV061]PUB13802.1 putative phage protein gp47/JayE [Novosphingobium sp. GV079]PUB38500.1 putative phage protein gp47/JayE [Novosphingobium sp. GV027]